ncbi:helix-turn-helix domain-containing protein [Parasphingorhabdus pacifica]
MALAPNGRKPVPPIHAEVPASAGPSCNLREDDRIHIVDRLPEKASIRAITRELGRAPSTVSREGRRNGMPLRGDQRRWAYRPHSAHRRAKDRRPCPKPGKISQNPALQRPLESARWGRGAAVQAIRLPRG